MTLLLVNSDGAPAGDIDAEFKAADLLSHVYTPQTRSTAPASWPTLQQLIQAKTRLLVFVASVGNDPSTPYLMDEFDYFFETQFEVTSPSNFSCTPHRPQSVQNNLNTAISSNRLALVNHFLGSEDGLGIVSPNVDIIETTNSPDDGEGTLGSEAKKCTQQYNNRKPTFFLVDFFDQGPAIKVIDSLNGVTNPVGRKEIPKINSEALQKSGASSDRDPYMFRGLADLLAMSKYGSTPSRANWIWVGGDWGSLLGGGFEVFS